ncbi:MAG: DUF4391 domain-containing protein [Paludibacteraceae bacterium]|nr:DUF4391 domain-containing protein [Paludibacteraceae bacterium]
MFGLPSTTEVRKQLPKKAIYAKFDLKPSQRESFDADIARIDIVAVVSSATVPALSEGVEIKEFYLLAVQMKRKEYDTKNIALLTKLIPQKMVLALQFEEQTQFAIYHTKLISSAWQDTKEAMLPLSGLNLDAVWENIVAAIGSITIVGCNTIAEQIAEDDAHAKLMKQIEQLEKKARAEKQPRKKLELFEKIKELKKKL